MDPSLLTSSAPRRLQTMKHLSNWHDFDHSDQGTYPKVDAPVQVRYADGQQIEVSSFREILSSPRQIAGWRYIKLKSMD
jgi:hypothetical protein